MIHCDDTGGIRAAIFDLDMTLVDTRGLWQRAEADWLSGLGRPGLPTLYDLYAGRQVSDAAAIIAKHRGLDGDAAEYAETFRAALLFAFERGPVNALPGASELVRQMAGRVPVAVASGSPLVAIDHALRAIGIASSVRCRISSETVPRGKPAPDVFLATAEQLGVDAECCVVFEDSVAGAEAARRAGMPCWVVPAEPLEAYRGTVAKLLQDWGEFDVKALEIQAG